VKGCNGLERRKIKFTRKQMEIQAAENIFKKKMNTFKTGQSTYTEWVMK
jgi:hypothetical protein